MRLGMLAVVRDECDLIREWVEFHAGRGVDCFLITDHASTDGTSEALDELARRFDLHLRRREGPVMHQGPWMTEMVRDARQRHGVDWVVASDADEFWLPTAGTLRDVALGAAGAVLDCPRTNMLPDRAALAAPGYRFFHNVWRVARPFPAEAARQDPDEPLDGSLFLRTLPGKTMFPARGLVEVAYGNHQVVHASKARSPAPLEILHYPLRSLDRFERQTVGHGRSLLLDGSAPAVRGWHQRRLYRLWELGRLGEAYEEALGQVEAHRHGPHPRMTADHRLWAEISPSTLPVAARWDATAVVDSARGRSPGSR
jgi:hypothetical protein